MQAHPSKPGESRTLWDELKALLSFEIVNGGQVSLINRLDRETSGLTLIAKTRSAARELGRQMMGRTIRKEYLAIVWGWPESDEWLVDAPLLREGDVKPARIYLKQAVHPSGAAARTIFRVERRFSAPSTNGERFSLVRAFPETGRMHQLRVHLAWSGHPIIGDKIYGPDEGCYLEFIETGWTASLEGRLLLSRHALHATLLTLEESGATWRAPLAPDLSAFLDREESSANLLATSKAATL